MATQLASLLMSSAVYLLHPHQPLKESEHTQLAGYLSKLSSMGWELHKLSTDYRLGADSGYFGVTFTHIDSHEIALVHRGTVMSEAGNIRADFAMLQNELPEGILGDAKEFLRRILTIRRQLSGAAGQEWGLFQTGHSLGGFIAEYLAALLANRQQPFHFHLGACAFESPGALTFIEQQGWRYTAGDLAKVVHIVNSPNLINTAHPHYGSVVRVFDHSTMRRALADKSRGRAGQVIAEQDKEVESKVFNFKTPGILTELLATKDSHSLGGLHKCDFDEGSEEFTVAAKVVTWPVAENVLQYTTQRDNVLGEARHFGFSNFGAAILSLLMLAGTIMQETGSQLVWDYTVNPDTQQGVVGIRHGRTAAVEYDTTDARTQRVLSELGVRVLDERVIAVRQGSVAAMRR